MPSRIEMWSLVRHRWRYFLHDWDSWMNRQLNVKIFGCMSCPTMDHRGFSDGGTQRKPMSVACIHGVDHGCSRTLNFHDISQRLRKAWLTLPRQTKIRANLIQAFCWAVFFDVFCVNPSQPNHTSHLLWLLNPLKCLVVSGCDDAPGCRDHTLNALENNSLCLQ